MLNKQSIKYQEQIDLYFCDFFILVSNLFLPLLRILRKIKLMRI